MRRWGWIALVVVALLGLGGGAGYWLLGDSDPPANLAPFDLDLAAIRAAADEFPGGKASDVRVEAIATGSQLRLFSVGGARFESAPMGAFAYQVILPADEIVIDSGFNTAQAGPRSLFAQYDDDAAARVDAGLGEATEIVVTHEHADHLGELAAFFAKVPDIARAIRLTAEQLRNVDPNIGPDRARLTELTPIAYDRYLAIAPGVVLIKAPGHTPGSQMIYVRREDGRELLFAGDIAWLDENIATGRGKPRFVSELVLHEDRNAVFAELAALKRLRVAEPNLSIVPGHDGAAIDALIANGLMERGFKL